MKHYGKYDDSYKAKIAAGTAVIPLVGELFVASDNFVRSVKRKFDDIAESAARQANDFFFNMFDFFNYLAIKSAKVTKSFMIHNKVTYK